MKIMMDITTKHGVTASIVTEEFSSLLEASGRITTVMRTKEIHTAEGQVMPTGLAFKKIPESLMVINFREVVFVDLSEVPSEDADAE
jgi:hypothetical protein